MKTWNRWLNFPSSDINSNSPADELLQLHQPLCRSVFEGQPLWAIYVFHLTAPWMNFETDGRPLLREPLQAPSFQKMPLTLARLRISSHLFELFWRVALNLLFSFCISEMKCIIKLERSFRHCRQQFYGQEQHATCYTYYQTESTHLTSKFIHHTYNNWVFFFRTLSY